RRYREERGYLRSASTSLCAMRWMLSSSPDGPPSTSSTALVGRWGRSQSKRSLRYSAPNSRVFLERVHDVHRRDRDATGGDARTRTRQAPYLHTQALHHPDRGGGDPRASAVVGVEPSARFHRATDSQLGLHHPAHRRTPEPHGRGIRSGGYPRDSA